MPRYYCDYCDTYLTHDSPSVRKQHNAGYKHKANVRTYYQQFEEQQTQSLIDQKIKEHLGQTVAYQQVGAAYTQHLASFPGIPQRPRLPPPMLPIPGAGQLLPGLRPPLMMPRPPPGIPGYGMIPNMVQPPGAPHLMEMQASGLLPRPPPTLNAPPASSVSVGISAPGSNGAASSSFSSSVGPPPGMYQAGSPASSAASNSVDNYAYPQGS